MAIKKSELYSSLWAGCDELRGGMDASQYKDYVLVMLFIKYISDKWAGQPYAPITIPEGASFADMVKLKGNKDIGELINTKILGPLEEANHLSDMPDFNDVTKLGSGKEMVDRLTNLIAIFENPALDFSKNRAEGDDILGDAYEYLMRHFAAESGKSKGQFYTPAEVSRAMAKIIGINEADTNSDITVYDPTCGSGSLLLRVGDEAKRTVTLYGQEKEATTAGLARMNMILHNNPTAEIKQGNTLAKPLFEENGNLKIFDFVIANPPFSDKRWRNGLTLPDDKPYNRFADYGTPPSKNGDYAFLLHIVRSLKRHGKGAIILPHGVLFRGNAEAEIRTNLIKKGYIKGIIGLLANLFYGTGIPAAIILIDKGNARNRKGIFMIDAGKGFMKDGNKNRLREQDIRKITDVFNGQLEIAGYSRMVSVVEIEENEFNLNIPRYIDSQETEDLLEKYANKVLIDKYDIYQHLMTYWLETMQDDCYIISVDGWKAETYRILVENKAKKIVDKGWTCDLVPKDLVINRYFETEKQAISDLETEKETFASQLTELEEEHSTEDGCFAELEKVNKANITKRIKEVKTQNFASPQEDKEELAERYETPLPEIDKEVSELESKVNTHLEKMGFVI